MLEVMAVLMSVIACTLTYFIRIKLKRQDVNPATSVKDVKKQVKHEQVTHGHVEIAKTQELNGHAVISVASTVPILEAKMSKGEFTTKYLSRLYNTTELQVQGHKDRKKVARSHSLKLKLSNTGHVKELRKEKISPKITRSSSIRLQSSVLTIETIPKDFFERASFCVFGLETTSLYNNCQIVQISATTLDGYNSFTVHAAPKSNASPSAIGHCQMDIQLRHRNFLGRSSLPVHISEALSMFANWLSAQGQKVILLGHNINSFDIKHLQNAIVDNKKKADFGHLIGYVDTLPLMRYMYPGQPSYSLERLYRNVFGGEYEVHNVRFEVTALSGMLCLSHMKQRDLWRFSKPFKWNKEAVVMEDRRRRKSCEH